MTKGERTRLMSLLQLYRDDLASQTYTPEISGLVDAATVLLEHLQGG